MNLGCNYNFIDHHQDIQVSVLVSRALRALELVLVNAMQTAKTAYNWNN